MMITSRVRRTALLVVPIVLVGGSWLLDGNRGGAGAALGVAMVTLFFAGGRAPMLLANSTPAGPLFLLVAMGYVLRVLLLLVALLVFGGVGWVDRQAVAAAILTCALLWTVSLVHRHLTSRQPTLVIEPTPVAPRVGALR